MTGTWRTSIRRLRKPSVAAWAVNRMVQTRPDQVAALTDLAGAAALGPGGAGRRAAAAAGPRADQAGDALVLGTAQAAGEDGAALSAAASRDAADTLVAASALPDATAAVVSGRLTRTLSYAGFW